MEIPLAVRNYVKHYFACRECSEHFANETSDIHRLDGKTHYEAVIYLWKGIKKTFSTRICSIVFLMQCIMPSIDDCMAMSPKIPSIQNCNFPVNLSVRLVDPWMARTHLIFPAPSIFFSITIPKAIVHTSNTRESTSRLENCRTSALSISLPLYYNVCRGIFSEDFHWSLFYVVYDTAKLYEIVACFESHAPNVVVHSLFYLIIYTRVASYICLLHVSLDTAGITAVLEHTSADSSAQLCNNNLSHSLHPVFQSGTVYSHNENV